MNFEGRYSGKSPTSLMKVISPRIELQRIKRTIHWRVPFVMVSAFTSGMIVAACHHILYSQISGQIVQSSVEQQVVTSTGTAFAFLVKILLALSSGTAFIQCLWSMMRTQSVKVRNMDSMFAILGNPLEFWNLRFWAVHPVLTLTAATTWLIPLSAVFTPGTMSVMPHLHDSLESFQVPQRNFTALYSAINRNDDGYYAYHGASAFLLNLGGLNMWNGKMLDFSLGSEPQNLTYDLDFNGPAIRCSEANDSVVSFVTPAFAEYVNRSNEGLYYSSWVPDQNFNSSINSSFFENLVDGPVFGQFHLDMESEDATRLFQTLCFFNHTSDFGTNSLDIVKKMRVIDCALHNATYKVQFNLKSDGTQSITTNRTILDGLPARYTLPGNIPVETAAEYFNAQAIMSVFGFFAGRGTVTYDFNSSAEERDDTNLADNPYLARALIPDSYGVVTFDQYLSMLEDVFQNMTLSWKFGQVPFHVSDHVKGNHYGAPAQTTAILSRSMNTFAYSPRALFIAYGVAIFSSLVCLCFGLSATYRNGFCYSNSFSSIVRMTRDPAFDELIDPNLDGNGADPAPQELKNASIVYINGGDYEELQEFGRGTGIKVVGHA